MRVKKDICDTPSGWCACGSFHAAQGQKMEEKPGAATRSDVFPVALPCGCRLKNRQGAWIAGKFAPTRRHPDGSRTCRCGRLWKPECRFVEILLKGSAHAEKR